MKTKPIIISSAIFILLALLIYISTKHDLLVFEDNARMHRLTTEEKIEDFNHLLELAKEAYPFTEAIAKEKNLPDFHDMEQTYLEKVKKSQNNREFVKVIGEMVQHLEHGTAHCDIIGPSPLNEWEMMQQSVIYGVSKKGFYLRKYWWKLLEKHLAYSHANLQTKYSNGKYVVTDTFKSGKKLILPGSIITKVDGVPIDNYIKTLFNKIWLRFDAGNQKVYCHHSPFLAVQDTLKKSWEVELETAAGLSELIKLPVEKGFRSPASITYPKSNVTCINLPNSAAYVKVGAFALGKQRERDLVKIDSFFCAAAKPYEKIIIDLRNNLGGAPAYWQKAFVERFIQEPIIHKQYTIVKKNIYDNLKFKRKLFGYKYKNELEFGKMGKIDFAKWENNTLPFYLDDKNYYCLQSTKKYEPRNPYDFTGEVFLLIDHDSFSATEDFAKFSKETGFAKVIGAQSIGGAAVVFAPWFFELPNSHIMLSMEIDMAFNTDGTINEIYGTKPDFVLQPHGYPTEMPAEYTHDALLHDKWIQFVLDK